MALKISPCDATLGATITGVDLKSLNDSLWQEIEDAFLEYALLFFPAQYLTDEEQLKFAKHFGKIEVLVENMTTIPISNKDENDQFIEEDSLMMNLLKGNEGWHTDSSYMHLSAKASMLTAHVIPTSGGETEWADMRAAYANLDETTKKRIEGLSAYHSYFKSQAKIGHKVEVGEAYGFADGEPPLHPLVKTHPETKVPALFIGRHATDIKDMDGAESDALLSQLMNFACQAPRLVQHHWTPGDVAVWDNRCVLHRARPYDHREERVLKHTRISGDPESETSLNVKAA